MINKKYFKTLSALFRDWEKSRREVQECSADALQKAKQAIFAFHKNNWKEGELLLKKALENINKASKLQEKSIASDEEGIFKASLEEFAEAELYRQFLYKEEIGSIKELELSPETYMGGLADLVGEIQRYAMKMATERNFTELARAEKVTEEIMGAILAFNFTGYLRTKFDQAKSARRKIEEIAYEVSLRQK